MGRRTQIEIADALEDRCCWKHCRASSSDLIYEVVGLCWRHWVKLCDVSLCRPVYPTILLFVIPRAVKALEEVQSA